MRDANSIRVIVTGPPRTAVGGLPTHLNLLMKSRLCRDVAMVHFEVGSRGKESPANDEKLLAKMARLVWSPLALAGTIARMRADIVHINTSLVRKSFWRDLIYFGIVKALRRKVIYQVHGGSLENFRITDRRALPFLRWILRIADATVVISTREYDSYKRFAFVRNLSVIPNAVDLADYGALQPKPYGSSVIRLVYLGRIDADKGLFEAVEAMAALIHRHLPVQVSLILGGSGPAARELQARIKALALDDKVKLAGPVSGDAKAEFWRNADILIFPSYHEGLPYTVLESLASGTPVIATPVGGVPDAIVDGVHGVFVQPRDVRSIVDAIIGLTNDRNRLCAMSAACMARARESYGVERLVRDLADLYNQVQGVTERGDRRSALADAAGPKLNDRRRVATRS